MARPKALIFVAPFGFGPAAKAETLMRALSDILEFTVVSQGNSLDFLMKHPVNSARYLAGRASQITDPRDLHAFDLAISVNNVPAVHHLKKLGFADRTILIDSLHDWRWSIGQDLPPLDVFATLVEDSLPGLANRTSLPDHLTPIATILDTRSRKQKINGDKHYDEVVHLGGILSPALTKQQASLRLDDWVHSIISSVYSQAESVAVLGKLPARKFATPSACVDWFDQAAPKEVFSLVRMSQRAITTPGIGFVEMAFRAEKPVILLPPMNSSQHHHYKRLSRAGVIGVLSELDLKQIDCATRNAPWISHAKILVDWLSDNATSVLDALPRCLKETSGTGRLEQIALQNNLVNRLETQSGISVLRTLCQSLLSSRQPRACQKYT